MLTIVSLEREREREGESEMHCQQRHDSNLILTKYALISKYGSYQRTGAPGVYKAYSTMDIVALMGHHGYFSMYSHNPRPLYHSNATHWKSGRTAGKFTERTLLYTFSIK